MRGTLQRRTWPHDPALYAPASYRRACSYETFTPDPVAGFDAPIGTDLAGIISDAQAAIHALNARAWPALQPLARLLLRTESIASSRIEGLHVGARDLARAEVKAETGRAPSATAAEILGNVDAMELAIGTVASLEAVPRVGTDDVVAIHRALMVNGASPSIAGVVRREQNWIGGNPYNPCGASYVPPPPDRVPALLADLCEAIDEQHLPPLVQAALVHAQFETIHPFADGNGRTGRVLIQVVLTRRGLTPSYVPPISVVLAADKQRYIDGLVAFREGRVEDWLTVFAVAAAQSAVLARAYLDQVEALQDRWREKVRQAGAPRADAAAWALLDLLPAHPVITLPVATAALGRTKAVVNAGLAVLEEAGVLVRLGGGERNRMWEADGLLDLVAGLEAGRAPQP